MYTIIELILSIFILIAFGKILKHFNIISIEVIKTIKNLAVNLFPLVTFFNIIIYSTFNKYSIILIIAGFVIVLGAYLLGCLYEPLFSNYIKEYVPYTNTCIESGIFALAIFVFTVITIGLALISGKKQIINSIIKSPIISIIHNIIFYKNNKYIICDWSYIKNE